MWFGKWFRAEWFSSYWFGKPARPIDIFGKDSTRPEVEGLLSYAIFDLQGRVGQVGMLLGQSDAIVIVSGKDDTVNSVYGQQ